MTIIASIPHRGETIQVEVLDVWTTTSRRKTALVTTLDGSEIFCSWTHGGWAYTSRTTLPAELLTVAIAADVQPESIPQPVQP